MDGSIGGKVLQSPPGTVRDATPDDPDFFNRDKARQLGLRLLRIAVVHSPGRDLPIGTLDLCCSHDRIEEIPSKSEMRALACIVGGLSESYRRQRTRLAEAEMQFRRRLPGNGYGFEAITDFFLLMSPGADAAHVVTFDVDGKSEDVLFTGPGSRPNIPLPSPDESSARDNDVSASVDSGGFSRYLQVVARDERKLPLAIIRLLRRSNSMAFTGGEESLMLHLIEKFPLRRSPSGRTSTGRGSLARTGGEPKR